MKKKLKVEKLKVKNIMKIKEVNICPKSELVLIAGVNAVGKTSVIKSLEISLRGRKAMAGITKIVNDEEKEADIIADFGDIVIKRHFTDEGKEDLKVLRKDGTEIKKTPQGVLNAMRNKMLKPYEFKEMKPKEQKKLLINSLNLDIDLPKLEGEREKIYDLRTVKGHNRDNAKAHLEKMEIPESWEDMPIKEISVGKLVDELNRRRDHNQSIENAETQIEYHEHRKADFVKQLERIKTEIREEKKNIADNEKFLKENIKIDETEIRSEIDKVEEKNIRIRESLKYREKYKEFKKFNSEYKNFTKQIKDIDKTIEQALVKAKMPIPGLEIYEDGLGIDGLPFAQLAESDQLKAAIGISMGLEPQPEIGVLIIENGRDLDSKNWKIVRKMAKENHYQIWVQYLDESGEIGFIIKEGRVSKIGREI